MILSPAELRELTGRRYAAWQARELTHLGIPYRRRSDGSLIVLRVHVESAQHQPREPRLRLPA